MKLEAIEQLQGNKGPYLKLTIDGKKWNFFGELGDLKIGDDVDCEFKKNGQYTNLTTIKKSVAGNSVTMDTTAGRHDVVITRSEKPHSYEFGKPNNRHKIYYGNVEELKQHLEILKNAGLMEDEFPIERPGEN